jgi:hypothetical protein
MRRTNQRGEERQMKNQLEKAKRKCIGKRQKKKRK